MGQCFHNLGHVEEVKCGEDQRLVEVQMPKFIIRTHNKFHQIIDTLIKWIILVTIMQAMEKETQIQNILKRMDY